MLASVTSRRQILGKALPARAVQEARRCRLRSRLNGRFAETKVVKVDDRFWADRSPNGSAAITSGIAMMDEVSLKAGAVVSHRLLLMRLSCCSLTVSSFSADCTLVQAIK
jgi:hypothetical protein